LCSVGENPYFLIELSEAISTNPLEIIPLESKSDVPAVLLAEH